jgi:hypothetical protein
VVFIADKIGLRHFSSTTSDVPVSVQSYPDIAPLFVTAVCGGMSKHCIIGNACSQAFVRAKRLLHGPLT